MSSESATSMRNKTSAGKSEPPAKTTEQGKARQTIGTVVNRDQIQSFRGHDQDGTAARKAAGAFKTISEVADEIGVQQHVLRFWETKFSQVRPLKRGGGRRYYRPEDVDVLKTIHHLLYTQGYTIKGVQKLLRGQGKHQVINGEFSALAAGDFSAPDHFPDTPSRLSAESRPSQTPGVPGSADAPSASTSTAAGLSEHQKTALQALLSDLKGMKDEII